MVHFIISHILSPERNSSLGVCLAVDCNPIYVMAYAYEAVLGDICARGLPCELSVINLINTVDTENAS